MSSGPTIVEQVVAKTAQLENEAVARRNKATSDLKKRGKDLIMEGSRKNLELGRQKERDRVLSSGAPIQSQEFLRAPSAKKTLLGY